jgi:hypothetical protein
MQTTVGTPSNVANSMVSRKTLSCWAPLTGCSWFPLAFSALIFMSRSAIAPANSSRAASEVRTRVKSMWGASDQFPVATSTELRLSLFAKSSESSKDM